MAIETEVIYTIGALDVLSYCMGIVILLGAPVIARAFWKHADSPSRQVRRVAHIVIASLALFWMHTLLWDFALRTSQLLEHGGFQARSIFGIPRTTYMFFHFGGFLGVGYMFCDFLRDLIPPECRHKWPWWRAPFYPNRYMFW